MATVKLGYAASSNISFKGTFDTGIEQDEWDEMTGREQDVVFLDALGDLVDMWEEAE